MKDKNVIQIQQASAPISEQEWLEGTLPIVSICCVSYNHENFIRDCLDGFLMQETSFPIEILIHDDASKDQSASIIQEYEQKYPKLIKAIYQEENQWSKGIRPNPKFNFPRSRGKYIAFCEGDDYWTDKTKLQQQIEILEKNQHIKLCFHDVYVMKNNSGDRKINFIPTGLTKSLYSCEELVKKNIIPTCSVVAVRDAVIETPHWYYNLPMNDWPRWIRACQDGYAFFIDKVLGVYRIHNDGIWSSLSLKKQIISDYDFFCELEKFGPIPVRKAATDAKRELVMQLIDQEETRINHIRNHIFFGPLLKLWKKMINKNI
ncbi:MAG: glycosyltransferase [Desulfobulbus sp.]|nr:glycosyltransferase [Desulfobulbus sp.]